MVALVEALCLISHLSSLGALWLEFQMGKFNEGFLRVANQVKTGVFVCMVNR